MHTSLSHFQNGGVAGSHCMVEQRIFDDTRHLSSILEKIFPLFSHQLSGWHLLDTSVLDDRGAEIFGGKQFLRQEIHQLGLRGHHQYFYSAQVLPSISWGTRWESNQNQELLSGEIKHDQQRLISQIQLGMQLFTKSQFENNTGLQIYHFLSNDQEQSTCSQNIILFRLSEYFLFWSSANRSFRPPTMLELYGNQASIIGNSDLIPETGTTIDGGFVWKDTNALLTLQASYFHRWNENNIILVQNAQNQSIPINFAKTRIQGIENSISFQPKEWIQWDLGFTWNHSLNLSEISSLSGNQLPNIPSWNIEHQLRLKHQLFSVQHTWSFIDQVF